MGYFRIDIEHFKNLAKENNSKYVSGCPFPHICLDNVFPEKILNDILDEFPDKDQAVWNNYKNNNEVKLAYNKIDQFGDATYNFIQELNAKPFLTFLEELTGIKNLIPDPDLSGGGLHQILNGGLLKIHADFNKHTRTGLDRRLNVLIYLNKNWEESYGGHFELWNKAMDKAEVKILPTFNKMAIFSTTSTSYHGHPDALTCPASRSRKSIALYYYTNGRPADEIDEKLGTHTTLFQERKNNNADKKKLTLKDKLKLLIPPILLYKR